MQIKPTLKCNYLRGKISVEKMELIRAFWEGNLSALSEYKEHIHTLKYRNSDNYSFFYYICLIIIDVLPRKYYFLKICVSKDEN